MGVGRFLVYRLREKYHREGLKGAATRCFVSFRAVSRDSVWGTQRFRL